MNKHIRILIIFTVLYLIVGLIYGTIVYALGDNLKLAESKNNIFLHLSNSIFSWPALLLRYSSDWSRLLDYPWNHKITVIIIIGVIEVSLVVLSRYINSKLRL
ncbi:MAG: hypothetical protein AABY07_03050 [Nanoarchaeota archaeon]